MNYQQAYLRLFNQITDIIDFLNQQPQLPNHVYLQEKLMQAQQEAEDLCTKK